MVNPFQMSTVSCSAKSWDAKNIVSNLLPFSSTWNSSLANMFLSHVLEKESP